jgi:ribosomal protein L2
LFLKIIKFYQAFHKSNTSHNLNKFFIKLNYQPKHRQLTYLKKNNSGRGASGKIIIRTKTSILTKRKLVNINYCLNYKKLNFIGGFVLIPFKNKLLSLFFFSNGAISYFLTTNNHKIFHYSTFLFHKKFRKLNIKRIFTVMFRIRKLSILSNLSITPFSKAQYVRSSGCRARLFKFDVEKHLVTMELPSKSKKLFSYFSSAFLSPIANFDHKNSTNGKAGY